MKTRSASRSAYATVLRIEPADEFDDVDWLSVLPACWSVRTAPMRYSTDTLRNAARLEPRG